MHRDQEILNLITINQSIIVNSSVGEEHTDYVVALTAEEGRV